MAGEEAEPAPAPEGAQPSALVRVKRRFLGVADRLFKIARRTAFGSAVVVGGLMAAFPEQAPGPLALLAVVALWGLLLSPVVGLAGMVARVGGFWREGRLEAEDGALFLVDGAGKRRRLARAVRAGFVVPGQGTTEVQLELPGGDQVAVRVADEATAEGVLELAGVPPNERRGRVRFGRVFQRLAAGCLGMGLTTGGIMVLTANLSSDSPARMALSMLICVAPYLAAGAASRLLAWREIAIGTDGIVWKRLGTTRFIPLSRLREVVVTTAGLRLLLDDGSAVSLQVNADDPNLAEALRRRIEQVLAAAGKGGGLAGLFARGGRSLEEWRDAARRALAGDRDFRSAHLGPDDVLRVLEDPAAEPDARLGAALALAETGQPAMVARVRVAAEAAVEPRLRVALEAVAEGDAAEEVLEAAQGRGGRRGRAGRAG